MSEEAGRVSLAYGHPRSEVVEMLEADILWTRDPIAIPVGLGAKSFEDEEIAQAVFATAWDGTVVLEAGQDGVFRIVLPAQESDSWLLLGPLQCSAHGRLDPSETSSSLEDCPGNWGKLRMKSLGFVVQFQSPHATSGEPEPLRSLMLAIQG